LTLSPKRQRTPYPYGSANCRVPTSELFTMYYLSWFHSNESLIVVWGQGTSKQTQKRITVHCGFKNHAGGLQRIPACMVLVIITSPYIFCCLGFTCSA
jgi:hypothetical protein